MSTQIRAELLKLRTVRSTFGVIAVAAVLGPLLAFIETATADQSELADPRSVLTNAGISGLLILLYGVVATTGEERHDTIAGTFLANPNRRQVLWAKAVAMGIVGVVCGLVTALTVAVVALPLLSS